ncbi:hypothetical protein Pyn_39777 [Prunus yedoensis var. nudiflora]|uniref:Uncharacterized protein n=1 Tax=Prunus yedoensis var. nudiflora TaxID=2094558 RepID=A0A314XJ14_PRUYE|nr:hypothetical protein Pyn_39777 [Prunus yedoensis var. nudiflora]
MKTSSDSGTQFGAKTTKPTLEICTWWLLGTSSKYKKFKKPRDFGMQGRMPPLKPTGTVTFFHLSDLAMERGGRRWVKKGSSLLRQPLEEAWSTQNL